MNIQILELVGGSLFIALLAFVAVKARAIDVSGSVAGSIISFIVFIAGGIRWLIIIVAFFVLSSLLTKYGYDYKHKLGSAQEKGGTRSWPNTLANGGVAAVIGLLQLAFHQPVLLIPFLSAVAAALSDTIATEVGLLSESKPRLITNPRRMVEPGTSGGISGLGELVAFGSALGIAVLGLLLSLVGRVTELSFLPSLIAIVAGAFLGTTIDSLLGASVQASRKCMVCGALTENRNHHGQKAILLKGSRFIDNNVVNFLGVLFAAAVSLGLYLVLR